MATIELQTTAELAESRRKMGQTPHEEPYRSGAVDGNHGVWFVLAYLDPDGDDNPRFRRHESGAVHRNDAAAEYGGRWTG